MPHALGQTQTTGARAMAMSVVPPPLQPDPPQPLSPSVAPQDSAQLCVAPTVSIGTFGSDGRTVSLSITFCAVQVSQQRTMPAPLLGGSPSHKCTDSDTGDAAAQVRAREWGALNEGKGSSFNSAQRFTCLPSAPAFRTRFSFVTLARVTGELLHALPLRGAA